MSESANLDAITRKLDTLIRLVAYELVSEKTVSHGAPILRRLGLNPTEIAAVFGTTKEAVSVRLAESRRPKRSPKKRGKK
jgi:hypothetical protein